MRDREALERPNILEFALVARALVESEQLIQSHRQVERLLAISRRLLSRALTGRRLFSLFTVKAATEAEKPFGECAKRQARNDIARPMRQQHHPGKHQPSAEGPHDIAFGPRQYACSRCQCADMHGMAGWEGISRLARNGHAMKMSENGEPIRPPLVKNRLEQVRQHAYSDRCHQYMVAVPAPA